MRKRTEPAVISKGCQGVHGWLAVHEAGRPVTRGRFKKGFAVVSESARFGSRLLHWDPFLTVSNKSTGVPVSHLIFAPPTVQRSSISVSSLLLKVLRLRPWGKGQETRTCRRPPRRHPEWHRRLRRRRRGTCWVRHGKGGQPRHHRLRTC